MSLGWHNFFGINLTLCLNQTWENIYDYTTPWISIAHVCIAESKVFIYIYIYIYIKHCTKYLTVNSTSPAIEYNLCILRRGWLIVRRVTLQMAAKELWNTVALSRDHYSIRQPRVHSSKKCSRYTRETGARQTFVAVGNNFANVLWAHGWKHEKIILH